MGLDLYLHQESFSIDPEQQATALTTIQVWLRETPHGWFSDEDQQKEALEAQDFFDGLEGLDTGRWIFTSIDGEHVTGIDLHEMVSAYGSSEDFDFFRHIAPYVEAGSFIELEDGNGDVYRYFFDGETCHEQERQYYYEPIPLCPRVIKEELR